MQNIYISREIKQPKYIQQHKSSIEENHNKVTFTYYSNKKHEMTDMYTIVIWKITYKNNKKQNNEKSNS